MHYVFANGQELSNATLDQIKKVAAVFGETIDANKLSDYDRTKFYMSATHGLMSLTEMNPVHMFNAVKAKARDYYDKLKFPRNCTRAEYQRLMSGWTQEPEVVALNEEINSRKDI